MKDFKILNNEAPAQALLPGLPEPPARTRAGRTRAATEASRLARSIRLSPKQRKFVENYLESMNAAEAARRAGYSFPHENSPSVLASPAVRAALEERMTERRARYPLLGERVIEELCRIAFSDPRELMRWGPAGLELRPSDELSPEQAASVAELTEGRGGLLRLKKHDKLKALELLGRHLGMFADRIHAELSGPGGSPLREDRRILVQFVADREGREEIEVGGEEDAGPCPAPRWGK